MITHGLTVGRRIPGEFHSWASMTKRCTDPNCKNYDDYGGRGITICKRWKKFINFYNDMGKRPEPHYTLGRIDNNGNYKPSNCRWETWRDQCNNRRTSHWVEYDGQTKTIAEWSRIVNLGQHVILKRLRRGWSATDTLTIPNLRTPNA